MIAVVDLHLAEEYISQRLFLGISLFTPIDLYYSNAIYSARCFSFSAKQLEATLENFLAYDFKRRYVRQVRSNHL